MLNNTMNMKICVAIMAMLSVSTTVITTTSAQGTSEQSSTSCAPSINIGCSNSTTKTDAQLLKTCCVALKDAADTNRECFCLVIHDDQKQSTTSDAFYNALFAICGISGTVDTLCSGPSSSSTTGNSTPTQTPNNPPRLGLTPVQASDTPTGSKASGSKTPIIVGVCIVLVILVISFTIGLIFCCRKKSNPNNNVVNSQQVKQNECATIPLKASPIVTLAGANSAPESLQYDFADLEVATNNFSKDNKIGRGGFGIVYKGTLPNEQQIAVKRLSNGSGQGVKEFQTEIVLLVKLQHRNLVKLLGFCLADDEALLVYEFVTNKSLDYFLFDSTKRLELNWPRRYEIIKGVARGMMYLHEDSPLQTMHRDLKAANILLDAHMCPKIADFGLARICEIGQTHINPTHVVGTQGYMAPEYLYQRQFSFKSDVYSFGVLILEIISGIRIGSSPFNQQGDGLLSFAWRCWEDEKPMETMDPTLKDSFSSDEVIKCVQLGLLCVQEDSNLRPTMSTIVHILNSSRGSVDISMPQHPAYIYSGSSHQSTTMSSTTGNTTRSTS